MPASQLQRQFRKLISFTLLALTLSVCILPAFGQGSIYKVNSNSCVTPPQGLVGWWPGNGNAEDIQNAHDGMTQSITYPSEYLDIYRQGFAFNGVDSYVKVPAHPGLDVGAGNGFTIELWVKPQDVTNKQPLVEWNNINLQEYYTYGLQLWLNVPDGYGGPGSIYADFFDGSDRNRFSTVGSIVQPNAWQQIAMTYDRSTGIAQIFYNGQVVKAVVLGQMMLRTGQSYDLYLGHRPLPLVDKTFYKGRMDEVSIYNRALSGNEIGDIYKARSGGKCHDAISGQTVDPCGNPMSGVTVLLNTSHSLNHMRLTDEAGLYNFDAAAKGNFTAMTAEDTPPGEGFNPTSYVFNELGQNQTANFWYHFNWHPECRPQR